jgi:hypothetical protein
MRFPPSLKSFVVELQRTSAKTYASTWPHDYIVRKRVDESMFIELVRHIRSHGYEGRFYTKRITYFDEDGLVYWTMGAPIEETTIVNPGRTSRTRVACNMGRSHHRWAAMPKQRLGCGKRDIHKYVN